MYQRIFATIFMVCFGVSVTTLANEILEHERPLKKKESHHRFSNNSSVDKQPFNDAKSPCRPFRLACTKAGFVLGDMTVGNRLIGDCISKIVIGEPARSKATGQYAVIPKNANASGCSANIHHNGHPTTGLNSGNPAAFGMRGKGAL